MEIKKIVPAPFTKGVNFSNWLEHRPADEIYADMFSRQDFVNVKKLGCDVIRLPIHFERFCRREEDYRIHEKILTILDNVASWAGVPVLSYCHGVTLKLECAQRGPLFL